MWFGVEETARTLSTSENSEVADLDGGWSGHFASMLEGDVGAGCWSSYEVNIRLIETQGKLHGPGSYVVDPASCSSQTRSVASFFNVTGERSGDQVSLVIIDDSAEETTMLFNGIVAGDKIVGNFSLTNGAPVSGTVVLSLADPHH